MLHISKTCRELSVVIACAGFALAATLATSAQEATGAASASAAAQPGAEELRAVFIDVSGPVRWRANADDAWHTAAVNDVVGSGVEVATGLRGRAALRVGRNATILMDAGTMLTIPAVVQEGETLRTTASVKQGRADFKVDRVGLANDFRVVTPSTTLAVKGTEFAVAVGALKQFEIVGARRNVINAIELKYALNNQTVQMSGASNSSSDAKNPAHAAVLDTAVPKVGNDGKGNGNDSLKDAVSGPAPVDSGSSAQASKNNSSKHRSDAQDGSTESSVSAAMRRAIALANERTERALDYLIQAAGYADTVEAQADMLAALKQLADARKAEALAALTSHQAALDSATASLGNANQAHGALNASSSLLTNNLNTFNSQHASASDLLSQIESVIAHNSNGDLQALAQQATSALMGMNTALESAHGNLQNMAQQLAAVNAIMAGMDCSTRPEAAAAWAAYQAAMTNLQQLASSAGGAAQIAGAAQQAAAQLQILISQLAGLAGTQGALAAAQQSLTVLANANAALAQSQAALAAIQAARDAAGNDPRAAQLGMVEQLYQQIVAVRAAMANSVLAQSGLIEQADGLASQTNSYAESVFALLGGYWRDVAKDNADQAMQSALDAAAAESAAVQASNDFNAAVSQAEGALANAQSNYNQVAEAAQGVSTAHDALNQAAANAMTAMGNISTYGHPAMESALQALDALEQALGQIVSQYAHLQGVAGNQPNGGDLAGVQAQGAAALQALLNAVANAQAASANAAQGANGAADAAAAANAVRDLALQLAERFGLNMEGALAAAAQAYAEAMNASNAGAAAANSAANAQALALLAHADSIGNIAAQIDALLAQSQNLSAEALAQLQAAQQSYTSVNEYGTQVFAQLSEGSAGDAIGLMNAAQPAFASLQDMANTSTAYVAALDGAESAARGAETAAKGARTERMNAQRYEQGAVGSFAQMNAAISSGNWAAVATFQNQTANHAGLSSQSANNAQNFAAQASNYYDQAQVHGAVADGLKDLVMQYGMDKQAWKAAAKAFRDQINDANASMHDLKNRADFYDSIAQMLAGRAKTDAAYAAAAASGDAHAQVLAIAAQLASNADQAGSLEQTARSNAERMFYRSARQYVERAGAAARDAMADAAAAAAAAQHAQDLANQANQASGGTNNQ